MRYLIIFIKKEFLRLLITISYIGGIILGVVNYDENIRYMNVIIPFVVSVLIVLLPFFLMYFFIPLYQKFEDIVFLKII